MVEAGRHYFPRTKFYLGFNKPGVEEYGLEIEKMNRVYGRTLTHTFSGGFYVQPNYDSLRAINLDIILMEDLP